MTLCYVVKRLREDKFLDAGNVNQWTKNFFDCTKYDNEEDARDDAEMFGGGACEVDVQFIEVPRNRQRENKVRETLYDPKVLRAEQEAERIHYFLTSEENDQFEDEIADCQSEKDFVNCVYRWSLKVKDR